MRVLKKLEYFAIYPEHVKLHVTNGADKPFLDIDMKVCVPWPL